VYALTDRHEELVGVHQAGKRSLASASKSASRVNRTRPSTAARSRSSGSTRRRAWSSWAVRTSTPRSRRPSVMARGTCTSM
jgi:hypothetical protein